jgi:hypothetical protein
MVSSTRGTFAITEGEPRFEVVGHRPGGLFVLDYSIRVFLHGVSVFASGVFVLGFFVSGNGTMIIWREEGRNIQCELPTID